MPNGAFVQQVRDRPGVRLGRPVAEPAVVGRPARPKVLQGNSISGEKFKYKPYVEFPQK